MAVLYITEYATMSVVVNGMMAQIPQEPPLAAQTVAIGGASAPSAAFNAKTQLVRIHTDAICSVLFGLAPTAAATDARMAANQTEYRGVAKGQSYKVAVISNT